MIVEVADHPFVFACELEISLPEAVAVFPLESSLPPHPSGLGDGVVQACLHEDLVDGCVADRALFVVS